MNDLDKKTNKAIKTIIENNQNDYVLAFSGGKDSIVLYDIFKKAGIKNYKVIFNKTSVDPLELLNFIKENYPEVEIIKYKESMFQLIAKKGYPTRVIRWCCSYLKHNSFTENTVLTGIRKAESYKRSKRNEIELNLNSKSGKKIINPIIEFKDAEIWEYIAKNNLKVPELYKKQDRIGCILCPMQTQKKLLKDVFLYPKFVKAYINSADRYIKTREKTDFKDGREMFSWWISGKSIKEFKKNPIDFQVLLNRYMQKQETKLF